MIPGRSAATTTVSLFMVEDLPAAPDCRLCLTPLPVGTERCPACGLHRATIVPPAVRWRLAAALGAVYAVTVVLLALTR